MEFEQNWKLEVNYWMPIPREPQEMIQWFYGEPNGYRLRTQPPWISEEKWNKTLQGERESETRLAQVAPIGSRVRFKPRHHKGTREGVVNSVSPAGYMVVANDKEHWFVEPGELESVIPPASR